MSLFDFLKRKPTPPPEVIEPAPISVQAETVDFKAAVGPMADPGAVKEAVRKSTKPPSPTLSKIRGHTRTFGDDKGALYYPAHYDLGELARIRDSESLLQTSTERHVEMSMLEGWDFIGEDPEMVKYVKDRIWEIAIVSGKSLYVVINQLLDQVALYGTAFLVVRRDKTRSSGRGIELFGRRLEPIASWGVADAPTMEVSENKRGVIVQWKQTHRRRTSFLESTVEEKKFPASDVFFRGRHIQPGRNFGRPQGISVIDDIFMLRRLEELVDVITQKYAFPVLQYIVGTKERPAGDAALGDGTVVSEIELAQMYVENMPVEGIFVTPERHEIKLIGADGKSLDLTPYIEHFQKRVQQGLRLSDTILGTGSDTKGGATQQAISLEQSAKFLQGIVQDLFEDLILNILLEGEFDVNRENMVHFRFGAPNPEETRAHENHVAGQYQADILTSAEARKAIGREPLSEDEQCDLCSSRLHEKEISLAAHNASMTAKTPEGGTKATKTAKKIVSSTRLTQSKNRPQNQFKTKSSKTRVTANDAYRDAVVRAWKSEFGRLEPGHDVNKPMDAVMKTISSMLLEHVHKGVEQARADTKDNLLNISLDTINSIMNDIRKDIISPINVSGLTTKASITMITDGALNNLIPELASHASFVERASRIAALKRAGVQKVKISGGDIKDAVTIETSNYCSPILKASKAPFNLVIHNDVE